MRSTNPATGRLVAEYPDHDPAEVIRRIEAAREAFVSWSACSFAERGRVLASAAEILERERERLATLMTDEMGKPIAQAEAEVDKCAWACAHFAEHADRYLAPEIIKTEASVSRVQALPLGVVLAVMPWNFPLWQAIRCAAPALMAGNTIVLKHASNVPGCALALESLFRDAGAPAGVFTTLLIGAPAAEALIARPEIAAVSLTGSEGAGLAIATAAGLALKKLVLELGGSDPFVVLADADPEAVAARAVTARTQNNGASCIAAKRFIVEQQVAAAFEAAFIGRMRALRVGDPHDRENDLGPLARGDLLVDLERQVKDSIARGAQLGCGGRRLKGGGWYYAPTVLTNVSPGMPAFDEETFGPVAAVTRARDEKHALELANHSKYGLGASLWTGDPAHGDALAAALQAGLVFVNGIVKSDPRLPFGGVKRSGYGRELGAAGIREFVNLQTVWVA